MGCSGRSRRALSASRARQKRLLAHPGHSGEASAGRGGVSRRRPATASAAHHAAQGAPRHAAHTSTGRTRGAVAGRRTPPGPAAEPPRDPSPQALRLLPAHPATHTVPARGELSGLPRALASGMTGAGVAILRHSACLCPRAGRPRRGAEVDGDGCRCAHTVVGAHAPPPCGGAPVHAPSRPVCRAGLRRHGPSRAEWGRGRALGRAGAGRHLSGVSCPARASRTGAAHRTLPAGPRTPLWE